MIHSRILPLLAALSALLASTGAEALVRDYEPLRHIKPERAHCLLTRHPQFVTAWLRSPSGSADEAALIKRNSVDIVTCFGRNSDGSAWEAYYDYTRIRAGLVRALLQSRRDAIPTDYPHGSVDRTPDDDRGSDAASASVITEKAGQCLARRNWNGVRNIILVVDPKMERRYDMTKRAIEREVRLVDIEMETMIALLPKCLPSGTGISIERAKLRAVVEEAALHAMGAYSVADAASEWGRHYA